MQGPQLGRTAIGIFPIGTGKCKLDATLTDSLSRGVVPVRPPNERVIRLYRFYLIDFVVLVVGSPPGGTRAIYARFN